MNNYRFGILGEYIAIIYLVLKGYRILKRRYKTKLGEIDIIASKNKTITAFEVKSSVTKNLTSEIVSKKQIKRIINTLNYFVERNSKYLEYDRKLEIILFSKYFKIEQLKEIEYYE